MSTTAQIIFHESYSKEDIHKIVEYFGGTAKKKKGPYWDITFDDPVNFFWMGVNMGTPRKVTGMTVDIITKLTT